MIHIWDIKGQNPFLEIQCWKALGNFASLDILHNNHNICPCKLALGNRFFIEHSRRFCLKSAFEYLLSGLAPVLILIAHKQNPHKPSLCCFPNINLAKFSILLFFIFCLSSPCAKAEGIAISPAKLQFEIYRGETAESSITLHNPGDKEISYLIQAEDYEDWLSFPETDGTLAPGETREVKIRINPPQDAANGEYSTLITLSFDNDEPQGQLSLAIATAIKTKIILTGSQVVNLFVSNLELQNTEQGLPAIITIELMNKGNVRAQPSAELILKKNSRILNKLTAELPEILPNSRLVSYLNFSTEKLEPGDYAALIRLRLNNLEIKEETLDLKILPYGTLSRKGVLSNLSLEQEPQYGEITKILAEFQNTGSINLRAKLVSEIFLDGKLANRIESDEKMVRPGEKQQLVAYLNINSEGSYKILSKILFEGEETEMQELIFQISKPIKLPANLPIGMMITTSIIGVGTALYYRKEVKSMIKKMVKPKVYYCIDCNREIRHKGRCLGCNMKAKLHMEAQDNKYR